MSLVMVRITVSNIIHTLPPLGNSVLLSAGALRLQFLSFGELRTISLEIGPLPASCPHSIEPASNGQSLFSYSFFFIFLCLKLVMHSAFHSLPNYARKELLRIPSQIPITGIGLRQFATAITCFKNKIPEERFGKKRLNSQPEDDQYDSQRGKLTAHGKTPQETADYLFEKIDLRNWLVSSFLHQSYRKILIDFFG